MEICSVLNSVLDGRVTWKWKQKACLLLMVLLLFLLYPSTASARVVGFITRDGNGNYYSYDYDALLDSYALTILGNNCKLYADFTENRVFALKDCQKGYLDYNDVVDHYALALMSGSAFDIHRFTESGSAKEASMPGILIHVALEGNRLIREEKTSGGFAGNQGGADHAAPAVKPNSGNNGQPAPVPAGGSDQPAPGNQIAEPQPVVTITPLQGHPLVSLEGALAWAKSKGAHQRFINVAPLYWQYGLASGLRPEILYAQAALETGFGRYGGQVPPDYNNWAGIKTASATGDEPEDHEQFATPEEGVRAHFNHVAAYVGIPPVGEPHGRYFTVLRIPWAGTLKNLEDFSGRWAPSPTYHQRILGMVDEMTR